MKVKKAVIWWLLNIEKCSGHRFVSEADKKISNLIPLVETLFPGLNYYSLSGFSQVMQECVIPVLKKTFPEIESAPAGSISEVETVEISNFLPSNGYEWQNSEEWKSKFLKLLSS